MKTKLRLINPQEGVYMIEYGSIHNIIRGLADLFKRKKNGRRLITYWRSVSDFKWMPYTSVFVPTYHSPDPKHMEKEREKTEALAIDAFQEFEKHLRYRKRVLKKVKFNRRPLSALDFD